MNRDEISKLIYDNGLFHGTMALGVVMDAGHLERFVALIAAAEREACAEVADGYADNIGPVEYDCGASIAAAIRARGQQ